MINLLAWCALAVGALVCAANFYLSIVRYPLLRFRGVPPVSIRNVSVIPLFGSLLVALSLFGFYDKPAIRAVSIALIILDTGGLHGFLASLIFMVFRQKSRGST